MERIGAPRNRYYTPMKVSLMRSDGAQDRQNDKSGEPNLYPILVFASNVLGLSSYMLQTNTSWLSFSIWSVLNGMFLWKGEKEPRMGSRKKNIEFWSVAWLVVLHLFIREGRMKLNLNRWETTCHIAIVLRRQAWSDWLSGPQIFKKRELLRFVFSWSNEPCFGARTAFKWTQIMNSYRRRWCIDTRVWFIEGELEPCSATLLHRRAPNSTNFSNNFA